MTQTTTPQEAANWLASGDAILIDVREPDEFREEHIAYANSLPLSDLENSFTRLNIPVTRKIIFQCLKGSRGEKACVNIRTCSDCKNEIYNLEGGITGWKEAGFPTVRVSSSLSIFRQVQIIVGGLVAFFTFLGFTGLTPGFVLAGLLGAALFVSGLTGWCGLALILKKMPWNK